MAENEKLSGRVGLDTTDFKTQLAGMNRELRVLESGFRASAAGLGDWAQDANGLELRVRSLSGQLEIQKAKVAAVRGEYERIKAEKGENSKAAQDLEIKLNRETESLGRMDRELRDTQGSLEEMRGSSDETGKSVKETGEEAEETGSKMDGLKAALRGVGTVAMATAGMVAALAASVLAVGGAVAGLVFSSADAAGELVDLSAQTGISTTRLQELAFIGDQVGTSLDTITGAQARLVRSMFGARDGTGEQAKAFDALGIKVLDASGNLRSTQSVFDDTIDALGKIQNPAERDALAMQIFGKSAQELNPLIKAGSAEMARLSQEAHKVGAVMSEEDVAALESFDDTLASLQAGLKGTLGTLAAAFLPGFEAVFGTIKGYLTEFSEIVRSADGDFGKMAQGLSGLVTKIAKNVAEQAPQMLTAGLEIVKSLIQAIVDALPELVTAGVEIILSLVNFLIQNLPMLINAGMQALLALVNGIARALPELVPAIVQAVLTIVQTLVENVPMLIEAALALLQGLAEGLIAALPILIAAIPTLVDAIVQAILQSLPLIIRIGLEIVVALIFGILQNFPTLLQAILDAVKILVVDIVEGVKTLFSDVGKEWVNGIWEGFLVQWEQFKENISSSFLELMAWIKSLLGIASPSKFGVEIGRNVITSVGLGSLQGLGEARKSLRMAMSGMQLALQPAGGGNSSVTNSEQFSFYAPVIVQGSTPPGSLGDKLRGRRY